MAILLLTILMAMAANSNCYWISVRSDCSTNPFCFTLDSLATIGLTSSYNLRLEPGTHYLHRRLAVSFVYYFTMQGTGSTIVCNGSENHWFRFSFINQVSVSGLTFINCSGLNYSSVFNLNIIDSAYFGCRITNCLYIQNSNAIMSNISVRNTIVGYNFFFTSSNVNITNITMTFTNSFISMYFNDQSTAKLQNVFSENSSGIFLQVDNSKLDAKNLLISSKDYFSSKYCEILYTRYSIVTISHSLFKFNCTYEAVLSVHSHLYITNSTFASSLNNAGRFSSNLGLVQSRTALRANSSNITLQRTKFLNCSSKNGGAIEISGNSNLTINLSCFSHNLAELGGAVKADNSLLVVYNTVFTENEAWYSGGAIIAYNATVKLKKCSVVGNKAWTSGGGGMYLYNNTMAHIQETSFVSNVAIYGGALAAYQNSTVESRNMVLDKNSGYAGGPIFMEDNCTFKTSSNLTVQHNLGGIMFIARSYIFFMGHQLFHGNTGSIALSSSEVRIEGTTEISSNSRHRDIPDNRTKLPAYVTYPYTTISLYSSNVYMKGRIEILNNAMGGLGCFESTIEFKGYVILANNSAVPSRQSRVSKGGGIAAYQCVLKYYGTMNVKNNSAIYGGGIYTSSTINQFYSPITDYHYNHAEMGGAMYMDFNSKLIFNHQKASVEDNPKPQLVFIGNEAINLGGAIFVSDESYFGVCNRSNDNIGNPEHECFIQYTDLESDMHSLTTIIKFDNNNATSGSSLYGGLLSRCTLTGNQYLNGMTFFKTITSTDNELTNPIIMSKPMQLCICSDNGVNCSTTNITLEVFKGETIELNLTTIDQVGTSLEADIYGSLSPEGSNVSRVNPGQLLQTLPKYCSLLKYNVHSIQAMEYIQLHPDGPCINEGISKFTVYLNFKPCPHGFQERNSTCKCHESLRHSTCNIDTQSITRRTSDWISYVTNGNKNGLLLHSHCPYDYCYPSTNLITINLNLQDGTDFQCAFNRSGTLCGSCREGLSLVLGNSKCKRCSNVTLLLLLPVALGGALIVILMLVLNLTVEVGLFSGMVMFANIVGINYDIFFSTHLPTYHSTFYISWINLDLGFQTCLFNGLDMYGKVWLEILFPLYLLSLSSVLVTMRHRVSTHWIAKLLRERNPHAVLATILLLTFNKFLILLPRIYSYATLEYPDGEKHMVWLADGSVSYAEGKHVGLLLVGMLLVTYVVLYSTILLSSQWLINSTHVWVQHILSKFRLRRTLEAYHAPYVTGKCSWSGVLVLYRMVVMLIAASTRPGLNHKANLMLFSVTTFFMIAIKDILGRAYLYRKSAMLETMHFAILGFLAITYLYVNEEYVEAIASATTISFATIISIAVITYHIYKTIGELHITKQAATCLSNRSYKNRSEARLQSQDTPITTSDITISSSSTEIITTSFIELS